MSWKSPSFVYNKSGESTPGPAPLWKVQAFMESITPPIDVIVMMMRWLLGLWSSSQVVLYNRLSTFFHIAT